MLKRNFNSEKEFTKTNYESFKFNLYYYSIINKTHENIVFLAKNKLNIIQILISKVLIDLCIRHAQLNLLLYINEIRENDDMKEKIKNPINRSIC